MTKEEVQKAALKHWQDNLRKTMDMNWEVFKQKRAKFGLYFLLKGQIAGYPNIFGSTCPYCCYVKENRREFELAKPVCEGCPLWEYEEADEEGDCCRAWEEVYRAFQEAELRSAAIVACARMIQKIEEDGDRWRW